MSQEPFAGKRIFFLSELISNTVAFKEIKRGEKMLRLISSIPVTLALLLSLSAADNAYAEDAPLHIPIPADDPRLEDVITTTKQDPAAREMIIQVMEQIRKEKAAKSRPLFTQVGLAVGDVVGGIVRDETRAKTRKAQMEAMQDPDNPEGISPLIAPKFD